MASRASEPPPGRSVTAGIIIVGDEILKVGLGQKGGGGRCLLHVLLREGEPRCPPPFAAVGSWSESNIVQEK